jgi:hypothetical protein
MEGSRLSLTAVRARGKSSRSFPAAQRAGYEQYAVFESAPTAVDEVLRRAELIGEGRKDVRNESKFGS